MEELFRKSLPQYLYAGMTAEEFWHGEPWLCSAYREALRMRHDESMSSEWRQGQYVLAALQVALDGALNGGKAGAEYPARPAGMSDEWTEAADEADRKSFFDGMTAYIGAKGGEVRRGGDEGGR